MKSCYDSYKRASNSIKKTLQQITNNKSKLPDLVTEGTDRKKRSLSPTPPDPKKKAKKGSKDDDLFLSGAITKQNVSTFSQQRKDSFKAQPSQIEYFTLGNFLLKNIPKFVQATKDFNEFKNQ